MTDKTLLNLIKSKLQLVESCKQDSFHAMMLYSETLPSLLLQSIGYIENRVVEKNNIAIWHFRVDTLNKLFNDTKSEVFSKLWKSYIHQNKDILDDYKLLDVFISKSNKKEFDNALQFLYYQQDMYEFIASKIKPLKDHRNAFSHGKINAKSLTIISKHDYYIYYGILLVIDKCLDSILS